MFIAEHLEKLKSINADYQGPVGKCPFDWGKRVFGKDQKIDVFLKNKKFCRKELIKYCGDSKNSNLDVIIAVLAWGGMSESNAKKICYDKLEEAVSKLRANEFKDRKAAFEFFQKKRSQGDLPGIGIAYFTKLICFISPNLKGYIMDQWVSKSINLLSEGNVVVKLTDSWVSDQNDSENYGNFCDKIDCLAKLLNCTGFEAEERLFSVGGRKKGDWRKYLIDAIKRKNNLNYYLKG